ncbi:uncharacterized protein HD556DRAFT_1311977 [Suillus plorans]|uniref:Uncharacterized protein n=1 Tax=Suillus plorans TaxID=116603 RepID=A0A9P7DDX3_9AGAM|nr:uncharacterized protein HD556DRAFT_1311977 [Suillus plorans]KAG1788566.1 hypothetical protein HD556DRAFT_1311977 [Suillus plorans]
MSSDKIERTFSYKLLSAPNLQHTGTTNLSALDDAGDRSVDTKHCAEYRCLLEVKPNLIVSEEWMSDTVQTKYVDREIKFVLENLDISSLSLLPGHVYICNITDVDITAPTRSQSTTTAIGTLTHIQMQAVHLTLKEVSFFYRDKVATIKPKDFTVSWSLMERESLGQFFKIDMQVKQSNHLILASVFWPVIMLYFRETISHTLEEQIW